MKPSYGGVVIDGEGRILIREVAGRYGGAVWTFPKGGPEPGESPRETALRETFEETGWSTVIEADIPGEFRGTTTTSRYFLMRPVKRICDAAHETTKIQWVTPEEAPRYLSQSSPTVRDRDLALLAAALETRGPGRS